MIEFNGKFVQQIKKWDFLVSSTHTTFQTASTPLQGSLASLGGTCWLLFSYQRDRKKLCHVMSCTSEIKVNSKVLLYGQNKKDDWVPRLFLKTCSIICGKSSYVHEYHRNPNKSTFKRSFELETKTWPWKYDFKIVKIFHYFYNLNH